MTPTVVHVGPDPDGGPVGGIAAVIRTLAETAPYPATVVGSYWSRGRPPVRRLLRALVRVWRAPSDAVVHLHMSERGSWLREGVFAVVARLSGKQVALTLHGALLGEWASGRAARALVAIVLRAAHVVFVLHEADAVLVRSLAHTPVRVIANPVSEPVAVPDPRAAPGPIALFLGVQSLRKGIDVLGRAWPGVLERHPEARLLVAGPVEDGALTGPGIENVGTVDPERARGLVSGATVVVLPSRAEALPMTLLEAMAAGTPFVATDVAGIPRLAGSGGGLLVHPGDVDGLTEALARVLGDEGLQEDMGAAGRKWWEAHGRHSAVHADLLDGYRATRPSRGGTVGWLLPSR